MTATYEPIATTTLGSSAATITFNSIPSTYTDLRVVLIGTAVSGGTIYPAARFNSDTGLNYSQTFLYGNGSSAASVRSTMEDRIGFSWNGSSNTIPGLYTLDIFSYSGSTNKTILTTASEDANGSGTVLRTVHLWRDTSSITTIQFLSNGNNYNTGTTATLFGIKAA